MTTIQDLLNQSRDFKKNLKESELRSKQKQEEDYQSWTRNVLKPAVSLYCNPYIKTWIQYIEPFIIEVSQVEELKVRGAFISDPVEHIQVERKIVQSIYQKGNYSIHPFAGHRLNNRKNNSGMFSNVELESIGKILYEYYPSTAIMQIVNMLGDHEIICDIMWHNEVIEKAGSKEPENLMRFDFHSVGELAGECWITTASGGGTRIGNVENGLGDNARVIIAKRLIADDFLKYEFKPKTTSSGSPYAGISFLSGQFGLGK